MYSDDETFSLAQKADLIHSINELPADVIYWRYHFIHQAITYSPDTLVDLDQFARFKDYYYNNFFNSLISIINKLESPDKVKLLKLIDEMDNFIDSINIP